MKYRSSYSPTLSVSQSRRRRLTAVAVALTLITFFFVSIFRSSRTLEGCDSPSPTTVYDVVFDAGSTGSRVHVFAFTRGSAAVKLQSEYYKRTMPGLSSFATNADAGAQTIEELLVDALRHIPAHSQRCTSVTLKATAGLRLLPADQQTALLNRVEAILAASPLMSRGAGVISGQEEGVFGWLSVNFLLGRLQAGPGVTPKKTAMIVEMGGGSAQVVFAPDPSALLWLPFLYAAKVQLLGGAALPLYQHSYLGLGLNEAKNALVRQATDRSACMPGAENISNGASFERCVELFVRTVLDKAECLHQGCGIKGVPQPQIPFGEMDIYAFSYFFDRIHESLGGSEEAKVSSFKLLGEQVCSTPATNGEAASKQSSLCMDLAYLYAFLKTGLGLPDSTSLRVVEKIGERGVSWPLGASLAWLYKMSI